MMSCQRSWYFRNTTAAATFRKVRNASCCANLSGLGRQKARKSKNLFWKTAFLWQSSKSTEVFWKQKVYQRISASSLSADELKLAACAACAGISRLPSPAIAAWATSIWLALAKLLVKQLMCTAWYWKIPCTACYQTYCLNIVCWCDMWD